jgi:hypothetical protein
VIQPLTQLAEGVARATGGVGDGDAEAVGDGGARVGEGEGVTGDRDGAVAGEREAEGVAEARRSLTGMLPDGTVLRAAGCW